VGRKSRRAAQFSQTVERHSRLRGGRFEGTNIPALLRPGFGGQAVVLAFGPLEKRVGIPGHTGRSPDRNRGKRSTGGSDLEAFVEGARFIARVRKYPSPLTRRGSCKARERVYGEQDPGGSSSFRAAGKAGRILHSFGP
jgi:hypothetical protein